MKIASTRPMPKTTAKWALCILLVTLLAIAAAAPAAESDAARPFSMIVLPDTQLYSLNHPDIFLDQTEWIKENADELNIACVLHEGDITNNNTEKEWKAADRAISVLDGVVPYCLALGNHDLAVKGEDKERDASLFNKTFGPDRFEGKPWYGGHYDDGNENAWYKIEAGGMNFLVMCLEFGPRDEVLDWANQVVADHPDRRAIMVTHGYLYDDDTRIGSGDRYNPHQYPWASNDGEEMWTKFVKKHKNLFLVLSGHILGDGLGRRVDVGDQGNRVLQVMANYQMRRNGGEGWLRIMTFHPSQDKITVRTFSPTLNMYAVDDQNQFTLDYDMK